MGLLLLALFKDSVEDVLLALEDPKAIDGVFDWDLSLLLVNMLAC